MKISDKLLKELPKVELHCHLDGSLRINTILDLANKENISLPTSNLSDLKNMLSSITGFDEVSLQPNAGAQGELAGLLTIRKFLYATGESQRNICLIQEKKNCQECV